ncbi:histone family protein [uncultured Methanobrevibacter sp.]|uniref:histone family protein n=1 Tax=uncultured Methanobrevibacter sp. TaxID=253161 RepID=UPI0015C104DE|nr:histone family protein [uncultured Methanobrevibacter sp.]
MSEIPKAPITRIMKESGAERISDDAKDAITKHLETLAHEITVEANKVARLAKRKTIKKEDIDLAVKNLKK